jgi:hypothetical protein
MSELVRPKIWLSLRETASEIGLALQGAEWSETKLKQSPFSDSLMRNIFYLIQDLVDSRHVDSEMIYQLEWRAISTRDIHSEFIQWDLINDRLILPYEAIESDGVECRFRAEDVRRFLAALGYQDALPAEKTLEQRGEEIFKWLCDLMRDHQEGTPRPTKTKLREEAWGRSEGKIGKNPFHRIWKRANEETGAGWNKRGRPKTSRENIPRDK